MNGTRGGDGLMDVTGNAGGGFEDGNTLFRPR